MTPQKFRKVTVAALIGLFVFFLLSGFNLEGNPPRSASNAGLAAPPYYAADERPSRYSARTAAAGNPLSSVARYGFGSQESQGNSETSFGLVSVTPLTPQRAQDPEVYSIADNSPDTQGSNAEQVEAEILEESIAFKAAEVAESGSPGGEDRPPTPPAPAAPKAKAAQRAVA